MKFEKLANNFSIGFKKWLIKAARVFEFREILHDRIYIYTHIVCKYAIGYNDGENWRGITGVPEFYSS